MVNFTFTKDSVPKIKAGLKWATTRPATPFWVGLHEDFKALQAVGRLELAMHLWDGSPRNGGKRLWQDLCLESHMMKGEAFTPYMVEADGFQDRDELMLRLAALYSPRMCEDCKTVEGSWHFLLNKSHVMGYRVKAPGTLIQWALDTTWTWWCWKRQQPTKESTPQ